MAPSNAAPLTDEERAELEELRAEKARREEEARARRERAELESLRAEKEKAEASRGQAKASPKPAASNGKPAKRKVQTAAGSESSRAAAARASKPVASEPKREGFGVRMVTSAPPKSEDEIPGMPPAQRLIIILAAIAVVIFAGYIALSNAGLI